MLVTTDAIVLAFLPHSDKARILHAYTRAYGRINYMVYGSGRKHPVGLYTPLTCLQITADYPAATSSQLPTLKEVCPLSATSDGNSMPNIYTQTIALFIAEVLYNTLRHPMPDEPMFDFIAASARDLNSLSADYKQKEMANFHLSFLIDFAARLGFAIDDCGEHAVLLSIPQTREQRQTQLRRLCAYFEQHVDNWIMPRSLEVLMDVFD